jgi:serine protease Do
MRDLMGWARQRKLLASLLVVVTLGIGILIGSVISGQVAANKQNGGAAAALLATPDPVQLSSTFASIADRVEPAVVNISTTQVAERRRTPQRRGTPDPFDFFPFDRFFEPPQGTPERSLGSGVIVDPKGYILTNNHVVEQATKIQVKLNGDRTIYSAKLIGTDELTDLAVVKIEASRELPVAKLGNSDSLRVGDWVLAVGSPFGLEATVTAGIVSAKDRANITGSQFQRFIQTDAAINPGNSGGPLVNMAGEVIGINTAIYTRTRGFDGVGFALPSNAARTVYNQLITAGRVTRGSIGISFNEDRSSNPVTLRALGAPHGMIIEDVQPGSPADKAGLKVDDVITAVNGQPVKTGNDLVNPIAQTPVGQSVRLTYVREGKQSNATLTVEDRDKVFPELASGGREREGEPGGEASLRLGLRVDELTAELARRLGIEGRRGVMVTEVEPASFAENVGFARGDVILEVNRESVSTAADFRRITRALRPGQEALFRVTRRAGTTSDRWLTFFLSGVVPDEKE